MNYSILAKLIVNLLLELVALFLNKKEAATLESIKAKISIALEELGVYDEVLDRAIREGRDVTEEDFANSRDRRKEARVAAYKAVEDLEARRAADGE